MTPKDQKKASRFLSLVLRHDPSAANIALDSAGWVRIDTLLAGAAANGHPLALQDLHEIVAQSDKQRFSLSADGASIRAAQGHSVPVDLGLSPARPPGVLFHGTAKTSLDAILEQGLQPQSRQQVHLSKDLETAVGVGRRHGAPVVLEVDTVSASNAGHLFYQADNGVWLTDAVPAAFLTVAA